MPDLKRLLRLAGLLAALLGSSLLQACAGGTAAAPLIEGDPWQYNLTLADMPANFEQEFAKLESGVITNRDVSLTAQDPALFEMANAQGRRFGHFVEFTGSTTASFNHVAAMLVTYRTVEGAAAALAESLPGEDPNIEWTELPTADKVGDESRVWEMVVPGAEVVYRVDFRFRNVRGSVGVSGPPESVPGPAAALDFARTLVSRLGEGPVPEYLTSLRRERLADVRGLAVTQEDLIELDPVNGVVWYYDDNPLPQWVPQVQGPVAGYQISFYRPVGRADVESRLPYSLVVTVLAYASEAEAQGALAGALGPTNSQKIPLDQAGEESAGFYRAETTNSFGEQHFVGTYEIDLRQGAYVAGVRVQAFQPQGANPLEANPTTDFLRVFARRQAERLAAAP